MIRHYFNHGTDQRNRSRITLLALLLAMLSVQLLTTVHRVEHILEDHSAPDGNIVERCLTCLQAKLTDTPVKLYQPVITLTLSITAEPEHQKAWILPPERTRWTLARAPPANAVSLS